VFPYHYKELGIIADCQIQALSRAFKVPIHVIQSGPPTIVSHGGADDAFAGAMTPEQSASQGDNIVRISYHRRMYGLGEVGLIFIFQWSELTCAALQQSAKGLMSDEYT
jgi:hypothetical protein